MAIIVFWIRFSLTSPTQMQLRQGMPSLDSKALRSAHIWPCKLAPCQVYLCRLPLRCSVRNVVGHGVLNGHGGAQPCNSCSRKKRRRPVIGPKALGNIPPDEAPRNGTMQEGTPSSTVLTSSTSAEEQEHPGTSIDLEEVGRVVKVQKGPRAPGKAPKEDNGRKPDPHRKEDFNLHFGDAILTLREDVPNLFHEPMRYDIFREDLVFHAPGIHPLHGIKAYQRMIAAIRFFGNFLYHDLHITVLRMYQPSWDKVKIRWEVAGKPRLLWRFGHPPQRVEALSSYRFDSLAYVYEHSVDRIIPPDAPLVRLLYLFSRKKSSSEEVIQVPVPSPRLHQHREADSGTG